ncbi:MAG: rRNA maturation RNase YbeY [Clostridia bacterium]|nr:rRNA maturation RNase YbeY [Clostridia bacterium]
MKRVVRTCILDHYPDHRFEVELTLCGDRAIRSLNRRFRGMDKATDVLSFPMLEFDYPDVFVSLGSIVISVETARRQAEEYGHSLKRELCFLCAHAALHLLGYDHETEDERLEMEKLQDDVLERLHISR